MKRLTPIIIVLLTFCSFVGNAQEYNDSRIMWGIKGGLDINAPSKWHTGDLSLKMYNRGLGGNLGAVCNIYLNNDFYLEPGLSLYYDTYSYDDIILDANNTVFDARIHKLGIRIPVVAGYAFDVVDIFSMNVFTGPELNYTFSGGMDSKYNTLLESYDINLFDPFGKPGLHRRLDCAWKIGIGFPTEYVTINIEADLGITDILKGDSSFTENRITFGLVHYF